MNNEDTFNKDQAAAVVSFLDGLIAEKTTQLTMMLENLKRIEAQASGAKEISDKVGIYIKRQQTDALKLAEKQQFSPEISKFFDTALEAIRGFVRATCNDAERLYFLRQGEMLCLKAEVDKLSELKLQHEQKVEDFKKQVKPVNVEGTKETNQLDDAAKKAKKNKEEKAQRVRPDQDPTTRAGRAAMDIAERRKKYQKKSL